MRQRLRARAKDSWPQLAERTIRHHGSFAYVEGELADGTYCPCPPALRRIGLQLGIWDLSGQPRRYETPS